MAKILHIVENCNGQATEKWLYQLYKELKKNNNGDEWSFFCTLNEPGQYSHQLVENGAKIFCSPKSISQLLPFMRLLRQTLRDGQYDVVHCHQDLMSAVYLMASIGLPISKRIIHVHNTSLGLPTPNQLKAFILTRLLKVICNLLADNIVGVSEAALKSYLNGKKKTKKFSVIHCAINIDSAITPDYSSLAVRNEFTIPDTALILLFVGRMITYKNPTFVLGILGYLLNEGVETYALFVGEGDEKQTISELVNNMAISERVKCLGWRNDIREIMAASDVLVFPSLENPMEGLGLTVVEAQSVGLPVIMSLSVPDEAKVITELVESVPLSAGIKEWGEKIIDLIKREKLNSKPQCEELVKQSSFSPQQSLSGLINLYNDFG